MLAVSTKDALTLKRLRTQIEIRTFVWKQRRLRKSNRRRRRTPFPRQYGVRFPPCPVKRFTGLHATFILISPMLNALSAEIMGSNCNRVRTPTTKLPFREGIMSLKRIKSVSILVPNS